MLGGYSVLGWVIAGMLVLLFVALCWFVVFCGFAGWVVRIVWFVCCLVFRIWLATV